MSSPVENSNGKSVRYGNKDGCIYIEPSDLDHIGIAALWCILVNMIHIYYASLKRLLLIYTCACDVDCL